VIDIVQSVPLARAVLCEDCSLITESSGAVCGYCGSRAITSLQKMLELERVPEAWLEALRLSSN
jgi:DNA-directed RNA polymerase subunit RPC12/RpoP